MEEEYKKAIPSPANWKEDGRDYFSVIELIWNYRTEFSSVDEDLMDEKMERIQSCLKTLSNKRRRLMTARIADLCAERERSAFIDGFKLGSKFIMELQRENIVWE